MSKKPKIDAAYDDLADVLYLTSGRLADTKNSEEVAGLVLRYDVKTRRPVGATILDFKEYWWPKRKTLVDHLARFFRISPEDARRVIQSF